MTKKELSQLHNLNIEIQNDKKRLQELLNLINGRAFKLSDMPHGTWINDNTSLYACEMADLKLKIEQNIKKCWIEANRINQFIQNIDDSFMRQIIRLRYIDDLNWKQVALSIGGGNTEDSVKQACHRFIKKNEKNKQ